MKAEVIMLLIVVLATHLICDHFVDCRPGGGSKLEKADESSSHFDKRFIPYTSRIVGGSVAQLGEIPWQVSVKMDGFHQCGAAILNEFWLISAAHCYHKMPENILTTVTVGEDYLDREDPGQQDFLVERIINHHLFGSPKGDYDFALIKIAPTPDGKGIQFNKYVQPIRLPTATTNLRKGTPLLVSGWGLTAQGANISNVMKKAQVKYINQETCKKLYIGKANITDRMFCAGHLNGGIDACGKDSGGPIVYKNKNHYVLYGIVSFGKGCAQPKFPGVYGRVTAVLPWIKDTINQNTRVDGFI